MPQYNHTANPQRRLGIEIQRFLVAILFPVDSQNCSSSTLQSFKFAITLLSSFTYFLVVRK
jgi:hypothetical protein